MGKIRFTQFNKLRNTPRSLDESFWEKVDRKSTEECWEWLASTHKDGYGRFRNGLAHRVSWGLSNGEIPEGMYVCHKCDNPLCCNPSHLFLGTQSDNMSDMVNKGRCHDHHGENNPKSKLTEKDVFEIHRMKNSGFFSNKQITSSFGVTPTTISYALSGRTWTSVFNQITQIRD